MMDSLLWRGARHFSHLPLLGLAALVSFGKLLVYAQLIGVEAFGSLSKMLLVSVAFGMLGSLGLQTVASRDLPALLARGRVRRGLWLLSSTVALTTLIAGVAVTIALLGLEVFDLSREELALGVVHGWSQQAFLLIAFESRSRMEMKRYVRDMLIRSAAAALAGIAAAAVGAGAGGIALAEVSFTFALLIIIARSAMLRANVRWGWLAQAARTRASALPWRRAFVMLAATAAIFVSGNLDRWIAAEILSKSEFGQYAFAWLALIVAVSTQGLLNASVLPMLARRHATGQQDSCYRLTRLLSIGLLLAGAAALAPTLLGLNQLIMLYMPQYQGALPLLLPLLLASLFRLADFWSSLLVVLGREGWLLTGQTTAVLLTAAGYALYLSRSASPPTALSLAWLATAIAIAAYSVSAAIVYASSPAKTVRHQPHQ